MERLSQVSNGLRARTCVLALASALLLLGADTSPPVKTGPPAVPAFRQANEIAVITVEGPIDAITLNSLERRIPQAVADGAAAIVIELDTPGGRLDATLDICNLLKDRTVTPANTVAWIRPQAYSAGAIIALACREIVVTPNASFGDAAPIQGIPVVGLMQMAPAERAKAEAPILAEVVDSARRHHYDENLVQSFVSVGIELWLIEHVDTGERVFVDRLEYEAVFGADPPTQITTVTPRTDGTIAPWVNTVLQPPPPDASGGLTAEEIREQIEYQQQRPPVRAPLTAADAGKWHLITQVISADRLLTVKQTEALFYGLAKTTVSDDQQLMAFFGAQSIRRYDRSWSEHLVGVLQAPAVRIVLIIVFLVSLFIEMAAPGLGIFGAAAAIALLVLVGSSSLAGMAQWWDVLLIGLGIGLLAMEIFVIPGLGIAGIGGALCLLAGLIGTFVSSDLSTTQGRGELGTGVVSVMTAFFAAGVGIWLVSRQLHAYPVLSRLILKTEVDGATPDPRSRLDPVPTAATLQAGDLGVASTALRPAGRGRFGGRQVDVQSPGRFIEEGTPIRVTNVGRYVVEVEAAEA